MVWRGLAQGYSVVRPVHVLRRAGRELTGGQGGHARGRSAIMNQLGPISGSSQMRFQRNPAFS